MNDWVCFPRFAPETSSVAATVAAGTVPSSDPSFTLSPATAAQPAQVQQGILLVAGRSREFMCGAAASLLAGN